MVSRTASKAIFSNKPSGSAAKQLQSRAVVSNRSSVGVADKEFGLDVSLLGTISTLVADRRVPKASSALQQGWAAREERLVAEASCALTQGYTTAFLAAAVSLIIAAAIVAAVVTTGSVKAHHWLQSNTNPNP